MITSIFLDAGGVILDESEFETKKAAIISNIIKDAGVHCNVEEYWVDAQEAVFRYATDVYEYVIWKRIAEINKFKGVVAQYKKIWEREKPPFRPMEGFEQTLAKIAQDYRIGIIGQYGTDFRNWLGTSGYLKYFTFFETQEKYSITKPDPRYFLAILEAASVTPSSCVMVGDRIDKDIIPAHQIGMRTIRIRTGLHRNQEPRIPSEMPDREIFSLGELLDAIKTF